MGPRGPRTSFLDTDDPRGLGQSPLAYHFLGGLLAHARALTALIAPTVNCYKRLSIGAYLTGARSGFTWTPAFITYGDNNRTHMFRTPEPGRFECRVVSGAVNPYLGMAGFIAAGLDGIERRLDPGDPHDRPEHVRDPARAMHAPRACGSSPSRSPRRSTSSRPTRSSGRRWARSSPRSSCDVKRREWVRYHSAVGRWEVDEYLTLF